jgi:precorrin-6A/cobalt-precorrin-6A reductase
LSMRINLWLLERPTEFKNLNSVDSFEKLIKKLKSISME